MKLITKDIQNKLDKAGWNGTKAVCKFFGGGACTWIIFGQDPDEKDYLFGVVDLGMGCVEAGSISLSELQSVRFPPFGLPIERDMYFNHEGEDMSFFLQKDSLSGV